MRSTTRPTAPRGLSTAMRRWWRDVAEGFGLEPHHLRLLEAACRAWDRMTQAAEILARDGITIEDRYGKPKAHPAVGIERDSRLAFARLVRELGFDVADTDAARPPRQRGQR
jgi:P27 family predicted phage terminase small subunit